MKNTAEAEDLRNLNYAPFSEPLPSPIEPASSSADIVLSESSPDNELLDQFLAAVKWVFLFVPGAAAIHFIMLGFALLYFYDNWSLIGASVGIFIFSVFMTMLGIGKLSDLRYLRVPASLFAAAGLTAIIYSILIILIPGDFFGSYAQLTFPLTVFIGYMVKRDTDKKIESD